MTKRRPLKQFEIDAAKRLKKAFEEKKKDLGLTQESAAFLCGWKTQSAVQQYLNGNVPLNLKALLLICNVLKIDPREISKEIMDFAGQIIQVGIATEKNDVPALQSSSVELAPSIAGKVPIVSWVKAGEWCEAVDSASYGVADEWAPYVGKMSEQSYALRVKGRSMEPQYPEGILLFVDPNTQPEHNSDVIVRLSNSGEAIFKRLQIEGGVKYLISLNSDYPNPVIPLDEEAVICGVVYFYGQYA